MARTVLVVEDSPLNRLMLANALKKDYEVIEAENGQEALAVINRRYKTLSAVLLDIQMPVMDGFEVLRRIHSSPLLSQLPVIVVTGSEDEETRMKALEYGANDFVTKPYNPEIIRHCLRNNIALRETASIINAIQKDKLTGIYNREFFFEKAGELIRSHEPGHYVLCCFDIDNFKLVNDQYGSTEGDRVLRHIGRELQRMYDSVQGVCGRISGDNFAGIYPNDPETLRLMSDCYETSLIPADWQIKPAFSIGRCIVDDCSLPVSAIYDRAYIAKQSVKGRYDKHIALFDQSLLEALVREQEITRDMAAALRERQFEVWFQPQYNHATGALIGAEALVRWRHPVKGLIPPGVFIPTFEQNGFIYELDKFVWEETCRCLRSWLDAGESPLPVSVNISRCDVFMPDLPDVFTGLLEKYSIPVELLRVEITESAFTQSSQQIIQVVNRFIELGFVVEIDDFGSGYSSLNTLKDVPAQVLKLDMRFLESSDNSQRGGNILQSIVRMAKWLGMAVIAEGVETPAQADYLKSIGCFYVQGYLYSRPVPASEFAALSRGGPREKGLRGLETVKTLDNNAFWDPKSLDTLIFNSYVGGACIFEYHDGSWELLRVNDKYAEVFGIDPSAVDVFTVSAADFLDEENRELLSSNIRRALETNSESVCETVARGIYGLEKPVYIRSTVRPIARTEDRFLMYCTIENTTAAREAEKKERESAELLESIMANISGGVAISAVDGDKVTLYYSNDRYYELFGHSSESYLEEYRNAPGPILPEDAAWAFPAIEEVMRSGNSQMFDFRARRRDGSVIWLRDRVVRLELANFQRPVQLSVMYDVTDSKEAEELIRRSEEELRMALSHSARVISRLDIGSRTLRFSPDMALSLSLPELNENMPYAMLRRGVISPDTEKAYIDFYDDILSGGRSGRGLFQFRRPEGWSWLEASYTSAFTGDGKPDFAVISYVDVTEQLEMEAIYKKWQQSLLERDPESYSLFCCNLNKNASYDTEEGRLLHKAFDSDTLSFNQRAQYYAQRRVCPEDRERYLSMADADVMLAAYYRGQRTRTLEYRERLEDGGKRWLRLTVELVRFPASGDVMAYLLYENIDEEKNAQRLAHTDALTGLLNRSAFEDRYRRLRKQRGSSSVGALLMLDLDGFKRVNDSFGHAAGDATLIEIAQKLRGVFREEDLLCRLGGDEFLIYMGGLPDKKTVEEKAELVCAMLHKSFSVDVQLSASVGIAVSPEDGEDIEVLCRKAELALYSVKSSGKDSWRLYSPGMGSARGEAPEDTGESPAAAIGGEPRRRMLIVEDNEINRDALCAVFDGEFIVDTAAEGTAALAKLKRYGSGISVVLLDLNMPGVDGFAVLKKMRESMVMQAIPVIVVSGMDERETALEAIRCGASDFITKPVDIDLLRLRVKSAVSKSDNEQLRAQNRYLALQNEEAKRLAEARRHSEELTVALHAAERADLAKSQFLAKMSHEIRTPLNAVIGYNTIARSEMSGSFTEEERRQVDMKVLDCLTKSDVASRHLLTIINDVLDMSAIESGKLKVEHAPFDFRSLITSLTVMFFSQARSKGVDFKVEFEKPTEEWLVGDQMRINQILTNLLSNAVKFTPEGGKVTLSVRQLSVDERSIGFRFVVTDTGIGMTPEYLEHIWTPFEQAEASISRRFGGTGLGLSITKNLVELMNGSINVASRSGAGSRFTVDLTLERTEQPDSSSAYDFSHINALVVDDDASTCDYIKLLFDRCGASCATVTSGEAAVEEFALAKKQGRAYNVCLVDWRMSGMDGIETITRIRQIADRRLPAVVVTAYDFSEVSAHAKSLGIDRFVSKPLFQSSLFDLLANLSGNQAPADVKQSSGIDFAGARVLLAEDNNMNMEVARRILSTAGLETDSAWNGREAVEVFKASRPGTYKAVLMDVHMPEANGYQATRMIRACGHPDAAAVPIIAMTADAFAEDVAEARAAGMNDHVSKPIDVDNLFQVLSQYIRRSDI